MTTVAVRRALRLLAVLAGPVTLVEDGEVTVYPVLSTRRSRRAARRLVRLMGQARVCHWGEHPGFPEHRDVYGTVGQLRIRLITESRTSEFLLREVTRWPR